MKNIGKNTMDKIGTDVSVFTSDGVKKGNVVIYPMRSNEKSDGGISGTYEGRTEPDRYIMFCEEELLKSAKRGDVITDGKNKYSILWIDEFSFRICSYMKACLKKLYDVE